MVLNIISSKPNRRIDLPATFVLLIVGTSLAWGLGVLEFRGIKIAPWDWASLIIGALWALYFSYNRFKVTQAILVALFLAFLFTTWMGICAFVSSQPERALTMFLLQIRNLLLFFCITTLFVTFRIDLERLNVWIFGLGVIIAFISVIIYIPAVREYNNIVSNPALWKPGIGYILDQGGVLRLIGLAKDPNFYSAWLSLSFFAGIMSSRSRLKWLGIAIIALSLLLAMSRAYTVVLPASTLILLVLAVLNVKLRRALKGYIRSIILVAVFSLIVGAVWSLTLNDIWESILKRAELAGTTPRFAMWQTLIENMKSDFNPIVGQGLRGAEQALEGKYSHNSYLDVLFETGVIGFSIWSLFVVFVTILAIRRLAEPGWVPWAQSWLIILGMFLSLSAPYHPYVWMLAAVIVGTRQNAIESQEHFV